MNVSKTLLLMASVSVAALGAQKPVYRIDANKLTTSSKIGAAFDKKIAGLRSEVQVLALNEQSKLSATEKSLTDKFKSGALTDQKEIAKATAELEAQKRKANFAIEEKNREVTAQIESERMILSEKIMKEVSAVAQSKGWGALDPITIFAHKDLDKTDEVLEAINKNYDAELARASLSAPVAAKAA